ncbi:MAG: purine-binding chemotaxis protein CheW [Hyphomonadaceae bacterium]|nr:purine-binding chemotaxis protein CheW [Clostridia bacterium]
MNILSFWLSNELYGIELTKVKEINRNIEFTKIPKAKADIAGLFNMRGQVVTLFNLAYILGYDCAIKQGAATCIILKCEPGSPNQHGFMIDKSGDVIEVADEMFEQPPANVVAQESKYIKSVVRLENELLRMLDPEILFGQ